MKRSVLSKLPFLLILLAVVVIATATYVEKRHGSHYALQHIYGAWWFVLLWALTAVTGFLLLIKKKMWRNLSVMVLHISLLVILMGAFVTHVTSRRGMVHLREGEATHSYWVKDGQGLYTMMEDMPFYLALREFKVLYDADGVTPSDYVSDVVIATKAGKKETTISMNHIGRVKGYRIYQTSFDEDCEGSVFTVSYDPWGTAITYAGYLLLAVSMVWISVKKKTYHDPPRGEVQSFNRTAEGLRLACPRNRTTRRGYARCARMFNVQYSTLLLAVCGTLMASYMVIAICMSPLVPILRSPYLFFHVGTIMLSYILLVVSIVRREVLRPAVFLLATGIFLGAVWANVSWGTYWSWDPKESWALVTLLIYSLPLHEKSLPWFRSMRNYRIYSLLALLSLLMTYFGVNYFLGGMHSYG